MSLVFSFQGAHTDYSTTAPRGARQGREGCSIKRMVVFALIVALVLMLTGCEEADVVSRNVSKEADNFNVQRRVTVYNTRTDKVLLEVVGLLSVKQSSGDIDIIMEVAPGQYKKHFVSLNAWTTYVVEDINGAFVDKYHYEINFLPQQIIPYTFTMSD